MKVKVDLEVIEIDGQRLPVGKKQTLEVVSHDDWNDVLGFVVLRTPDGKTYTVSGQELEKAVGRCLDL